MTQSVPAAGDREAIAWPLALATMHAALWWWANHREGVWLQVPAIDESADLRVAWIFWKALVHGDLGAFVFAWMHANPVHTPLVPAASAILMFVFGPSRSVAEAVLPLSTAVWLIATYAVLFRLYDRRTARWATALVSAFPVFLIYSRTYLFEHPAATVFTCACWALLETDGFTRRPQVVLSGVLAGLTALTRGGAPLYLIGPVVVAFIACRDEPGLRRRLVNLALAADIAGVIAATWYLPNLLEVTTYVYRAIFGLDAAFTADGMTAVSLASVWYYVTSLVIQGPGLPMLCVALFAWIVTLLSGSRPLASPSDRALAAAFVIDFVLLLPVAAQHEIARYFQPLMAVIAVAIVRPIILMPVPAIRRIVAAIVAVLAIQHVVALTLTFPLDLRRSTGNMRLWDHQTHLSRLAEYYGLRTAHDDFRIPQTIDLLSRLALPPFARIGTVQTLHGFFQPNGLQLEAERRDLDWTFIWSPPLHGGDAASVERALPSSVDVLLVRTGGPTGIELSSITPALPMSFLRSESIALGDGSVVTVFKK